MKTIPLTQGKYAIVDDEDYDSLASHKWCAVRMDKKFYAVRAITRDGGFVAVLMHRAILNPPPDRDVDHINNNSLDNRRSNLRVATKAENQWNRPLSRNNSSGFKGVTFHKAARKWMAQITHRRKFHYLGLFERPDEAARAYDEKATELFGPFANLNFKTCQAEFEQPRRAS